MIVDDLMRRFTELPRKGTPAADLTERDEVALALALGLPHEFVTEGTKITCNILPPFGVADRGDGGYVIASKVP